MIFDRIRLNDINTIQEWHWFGWYPNGETGESHQDRECRIARQWLFEQIGRKNTMELFPSWAKLSVPFFLSNLCDLDLAPLVELLYPRDPQLFLTSHPYHSEWFLDISCLPPDLLSRQKNKPVHFHIHRSCLNALCLCALYGAESCLEALLELGADPDGLDSPDGWSYIEIQPGNKMIPVTPVDCAILTGEDNCRMLLEMYGGEPLRSILGR